MIPKIIEEINSRQAVDISVIGHTDTVSTMKLNERLSRQRAEKIVVLLKKKGVNFRAITLESHSERNLLIPTPDNKYEPRNRRVEVLIPLILLFFDSFLSHKKFGRSGIKFTLREL